MASRPRRSTASTSYTHLLAPAELTSSSSSSSSSEGEGNKGPNSSARSAQLQAQDKDKNQKRKKRKSVYIPDESSGSEFELPDKSAGAGGDDDEEDDYDDAGDSGLDQVDDIDAGGSTSEASGSIVGGSPSSERAGRRNGRGRGRGGRRSTGAGRSTGRAAVVVTSAAVAHRTGSAADGVDPPRAQPPLNHPPSGLGAQHSFIGPLASFAPTVPLRGFGKGSKACRPGKATVISDNDEHERLEVHSGNPFGVDQRWVRDMAYVPGRFEVNAQDRGHLRERPRWGGWYDEIRVDHHNIEIIANSDVSHFLPIQTYPTDRPSTVFTPSVPMSGSTETAGDAGSAPASPAQDPSVELPVPPVQSEPDVAAASSSSAPPRVAQSETASGSIRIKCGGLVESGAEEQTLELRRFDAKRLDEVISKKAGHLFNAGAPISGLAFAPPCDTPADKDYLLVTTASHPDDLLRNPPSRTESPAPPESSDPAETSRNALLQVWSVPRVSARETAGDKDLRMRFELGLCIEGMGECRDASWCPFGGHASDGNGEAFVGARTKGKGKERNDGMDLDEEDTEQRGEGCAGEQEHSRDKLGLIATAFADGTAALFAVPNPAQLDIQQDQPVYVKGKPLVRLRLPNTSICSIAWGGHEILAAGCLNGYIAVWRVGDLLRRGHEADRLHRPTHYFAAHTAMIRQLVFVSTPPPKLSDRAAHDLDGTPVGVVSVGYDGSAVLSDLREPGGCPTVLTHERTALYTVAFSPHTGMAYTLDADDRIKALGLKPSMQGNEARINNHRGSVWSIAASPHHAIVLSTSFDGSAMIASGVRAMRKRRLRGHYLTRLYRLEVERKTGAVRMWDNLEVEFRMALDPHNPYANVAVPLGRSTAAWPPEQAVTAATWHPSLACAPVCATGTAIGLGRIDWTEGGQTKRSRIRGPA